jgi:hypothetical protein
MDNPLMGQPLPTEEAGDAQPDMSNGYCIEVHVTPDGQISVTVEPKSAEDAEGAHDESEAQVVNSPREAAKLVVDIINSQGAMKDTGADDAAMEQGFKPGMQ